MRKILIIGHGESDFSKLIMKTCSGSDYYDFSDWKKIDFDTYDAYAFLGGNGEDAEILVPPLRAIFESLRESGKPVFAEFIRSVGYCPSNLEKMDHQRMVYRECGIPIEGLAPGDILDGHFNDCCWYQFMPKNPKILVTYHNYINAHDHIDPQKLDYGIPALWMPDDNTLIASMRLCNFRRARFAPEKNWQCVLTHILDFLAGEKTIPVFPEPVCTFDRNAVVEKPADTDTAVQMGLNWFKTAEMLVDGGRTGVLEGLSHHISARDGKQKREVQIRTDCSGETGGAFMMDWLLTGNLASKQVYEDLEDLCFNYLQEKKGHHKGMLRWSANAWGITYGDDVARAILPTMLCQNYTAHGSRHFMDAVDSLWYLLNTTGPNGLRSSSTLIPLLTPEEEEKLRETNDKATTKAHHNSFYQAMLLLAYRAGGPQEFFAPAVKGLTTIMELYPNNERETSETEEMCRLIFPLSVLYQVTGEEKHKEWLYRVASDLERVQHSCGGFCEWDTDYRASCSRRENGECALLANNGDPVADLLYSTNWLPLGFAYAYMVTKDPYFYQKWLEVAGFLVRCQVHSEDSTLHGSWSRGFDMERWEIYGVPHDIGWSPCCVETGWTMGEILMGLQFMKFAERMEK